MHLEKAYKKILKVSDLSDIRLIWVRLKQDLLCTILDLKHIELRLVFRFNVLLDTVIIVH